MILLAPRSGARCAVRSNTVWQLLLLATATTALFTSAAGCRISEFPCRTGAVCLPLDKYCDGQLDCVDASDEPKFCTVCNRTYYGDIGRTYTLRVPPPQWNRLPFLCHLTFTASGHDQGDIVQILFDGFSVGRFDEGIIDSDTDTMDTTSLSPIGDLPGCPEGFMQLSELGRPFTGGSWCGSASGHQLYYSETSTVTASVKVFHAPMQAATPFEFHIRYKFISQSDAVVRYGPPDELFELGRVTPGTYCTRQFEECYRKKCRLQSPNYPGMYPRNVTCYWTIRQKTVPTCKHAMVAVSQENEFKSLEKRSIASFNKTARSIRAWSDCTGERDHLIFYDGSSTNDPVLAKYCGGDWLPKVVSRASEMLVAFHSSPFSAPLQTGITNRGFELDVDILFVDSDSHDFARGYKNCEFHINATSPEDVLMSRRGRMGRILSPRHTLPPNTTCTYYFHGHSTDLIWISFTNYHLQILQPITNDNTSFGDSGGGGGASGGGGGSSGVGGGRASYIPYSSWITRLRVWDSLGTYSPTTKTMSHSSTVSPTNRFVGGGGGNVGVSGTTVNVDPLNKNNPKGHNITNSQYYYSPHNPIYGKTVRINVDNVWNPVDSYIYGPTKSSVFNQNQYGGVGHAPASGSVHLKLDKAFGNNVPGLGNIKDSAYNYMTNVKYPNAGSANGGNLNAAQEAAAAASVAKSQRAGGSRKLLLELYDNEAPKLCDHSALESSGNKMRPCTPFEGYVSAGRDLKIEFHTQTGTALYPSTFSLNYEFVDTNLGGEAVKSRPTLHGADMMTAKTTQQQQHQLCSRVFRKGRGDVQSPRNVFLHGRGGAKNLTCLFRFEADVGEKVRLVLHNVSFGESATCLTEADGHTGRPKCMPTDSDADARIGELKLFDVPYHDVRIPLGCFCDNTSTMYTTPLTFHSNSRTLELLFNVTKLNISEDFADIYFHASYEFVRTQNCRKRSHLRGDGGEEQIDFAPQTTNADDSCQGMTWYIESQHPERSLFVLTWGTFMPIEPTVDDTLRCHTKNRLLVYSGLPLRVIRSICPSQTGIRPTALHIFSEDWLNTQPQFFAAKSASMVLEPVFKEAGLIGFSWLEIQRTKASLLQQLDSMQTNFTGNETLGEYGLLPKNVECEHKCPELNACIGSNLWCDGRPNCPSGIDESAEECGTARRLLELPGGIFAALGCIAAACAACMIFCIFGLMRKRKKLIEPKLVAAINGSGGGGGGTLKHENNIKKERLFIDPGS